MMDFRLLMYSHLVTYNKVNTYDWFKEHLTSIDDIDDYDNSDKQLAMRTVLEHESLVKVVFIKILKRLHTNLKLMNLKMRL